MKDYFAFITPKGKTGETKGNIVGDANVINSSVDVSNVTPKNKMSVTTGRAEYKALHLVTPVTPPIDEWSQMFIITS